MQQLPGGVGRGAALVGAVVGLSVVVASSAAPQPAVAASGTPGVPGIATLVYTENFENGSSTTIDPPALITDYVGATGMTYSADAFWASLPYCDGIVVAATSVGTPGADLCARQWVWDELRVMSGKLSAAFGEPGDQFGVASYTAADNVPGAYIQIKTNTPITIPSGSAYLTVSVDTIANNCGVSGPKYFLKLSDANGVATPVVSGLISPCTDPNAILDSTGGKDAYLARTVGDSPALITTSDVVMTIENQNLSGRGNDAVIDNLMLWDASPQLDKTFEPATVAIGEPAVARFTITNTYSPNGAGEFNRLDPKPGWQFTDLLPDGVTVAGTPTTGTGAEECANFSADGTTDTSVVATGDLSRDQVYCVIDVPVAATAPGDYTNLASDVTTVGVKPPGDANITFTAAPAMTLVKSGLYKDANTNGVADPGDTIDYVFVATNTGNVPLVDLAITDPVAGTVTCDPTTIAVGESTTCTADAPYIITQADVDSGGKYNNATADAANSFDPTDVVEATDNTTTPLAADPAIELDKTADTPVDANNSALADAGDTIQYRFAVTNTGNVTLNELRIDDPLAGTATCDVTTLAPGEMASCTADALYTITDADQTAGEVVNTAVALAVTPAGNEAKSNIDEETTPVETPMPSLLFEKTAGTPVDVNSSGLVDAGDTIQYSFTVTNNGNVTVNDVAIVDPLIGTATCDVTTLAPTETATCTADEVYTVTEADETAGEVVNSANATAVTPGGEDVTSNTDETTTEVDTPMPSLQFEKTAGTPVDVNSSGLVDVGDTIQYTFTVTNTGNVPMTDLRIDDPLAGTATCDVTTLAPTEVASCTADALYTITAADQAAGAVFNTATAYATTPDGEEVPSNTDETTTPVVTPMPSLLFEKVADTPVDTNNSGTVDAGDTIQYTFTVTNNGDVPMTNITVTDELLGSVTCESTTLAVGDSTACSADNPYVITVNDQIAGVVNNVAVSTGTDPDGNVVTSNEDETTTVVDVPAPSLLFEKIAGAPTDLNNSGLVDAGDTVRYSFRITNNGNVTMTDIKVDDGKVGTVTCAATTLAPGEKTECVAEDDYVITAADVTAGDVMNVATATGIGPDGKPTTSNEDKTITPVTKPNPQIELTKEALDPNGAVTTGPVTTGNELRYRFTVTNTGNVVVKNIKIDDAMIGSSTCEATELAPQASTTCLADNKYVVTAANAAAGSIKNTATATGTNPDGGAVKSNPASVVVATVLIQTPDTGAPVVRMLTAGALLAVAGFALVALAKRKRPAEIA